ncbi:restriction endonuclease subunit S [Pseudomonas aeruginosa]
MINLVPFGSVCSLQNGRAFKPEEWSASGTPIVRIQNLNDETKPFNYCDFEVEKRFHVDSGDLLFSWSGTPGTSFGAFFWNRGKGFLNQHIFRVDIDERHIDKNYLRYAINSKLDLIIDQAHGGVGLKHITKGKLEAVDIPLPPRPEQKRIAAILDKADAIRRKRQQAIQLADDFLRAVFLDMFGDPVSNPKGWEVKPLGSLVVNKDGKRIPIKASDRADMAGEYPYYGASGVIDYVNDFIFEGRHLLVGEDGANLLARSTPIAFIADGRYWVNNHAHVLGEKNGLSLDYLEFSINMRGLESFVSGSAQPKLNQENLNKIPIQVPPLILVDKFSAILNGCREYIGKMIISEPEVLFSSLSQKAFSGQLFARKSPCV